jgi:membrane protease YdiL (CAAX protease family)
MPGTNRSWKKIATFVVLTFAISSVFYWIMRSTGSARDIGVLWMWSPALGAILTKWLFRESLRDFGWGSGPKKYVLWGLMIPLLYALVIYGVAWVTRLAGFRPPTFVLLLFLPVGFVFACLAALGEEIGWRGFLVPELLKVTTFTKASFITWIMWAVWHYPAIIFADYRSQAPRWFDLASLTVTVLGLSFFTTWLRAKSGSLWPAVFWHGAHNLFIQEIFLHMTNDVGPTEYIVDDFGVGVMLATLTLGYVSWKRRFELPRADWFCQHLRD